MEISLTATVDDRGNLSLDAPVQLIANSRVRVIILCSEESLSTTEIDPDDTPIDEVKASFRRALQESKAGQRIPLERLWESSEPQC